MSNKLVFIKSIPRSTATGVSEWISDTSGKKLQKTKIGNAADKLMALYSSKVGGLANYISYNYLVDPSTGQPTLDENNKPILLQTHLEKKWNKPAGYFSNQAAPRNYSGDGSDLGYYYQTSWTLKDGTTVLDLNTMDGELGYYVMLASSLVANSEQEWRSHKWPKAMWYIALENESAELKFTKNQLKSKAYAALEAPEFTQHYKRIMVTALELSNARVELTPHQVYNLLIDYIEMATAAQIDKFLNLYKMIKTKDGKDRYEAMWTLYQAEAYRVVLVKSDVWTWITPNGQNIVIGDRYSEALDYILSPKKVTEVEELLAQIKEKQKA